METKKKKIFSNIVMCIVIAIIAVAGVVVVNNVNRQSGTSENTSITLNTKEFTTVRKVQDSKDSAVDVNGEIVEKTTNKVNTSTSKAILETTTKMSKEPQNTKELDSTIATTQKVKTNEPLQCTIQIKCVTILSNMDNLNPEKKQFVPKDGVILKNTTVEFKDGETAFDVLNRVCTAYNIELEYSYTPLYKSNYIESINHLREFDCKGETPDKNLSGWMYSINGTYPNYGCSLYYLKNGDAISWDYTCNGYGADIS